ncbi:MAG: DUF934 domain-containing protein [Methylococcales bacterium]
MLVKNGEICENQWAHLTTETIPDNGSITLPLDRWMAEQQISTRRDPVGVRLLPDSNLSEISNHLANLEVIVIEFPVLADGRVFSFAQLLRRNGYKGEIRAIGNFVTDQMYYLQRVGVNSFEIPETVSEQTVQETLNRFSVSYQ